MSKKNATVARLAVHEFKTGGTTVTAYSLRCCKCKCSRQMSYQGGTRARCTICGHTHRVESLFPHATALHATWRATPEQIAEAKAEYVKRCQACRALARESFLAQPIRIHSILDFMEAMGLPSYDEILREIVTTKKGLKTDPHTRETLRQDAYRQSYGWYGQGIKQADDRIPQY